MFESDVVPMVCVTVTRLLFFTMLTCCEDIIAILNDVSLLILLCYQFCESLVVLLFELAYNYNVIFCTAGCLLII